jgi:hypothetical protein
VLDEGCNKVTGRSGDEERQCYIDWGIDVVKNFSIKITAKQLRDFLIWEHDHQMKLFPWMEEEDENTGQAVGDVSTGGAGASVGGRDVWVDESF